MSLTSTRGGEIAYFPVILLVFSARLTSISLHLPLVLFCWARALVICAGDVVLAAFAVLALGGVGMPGFFLELLRAAADCSPASRCDGGGDAPQGKKRMSSSGAGERGANSSKSSPKKRRGFGGCYVEK